jgi:chemotaxis protein MotB
MKNYALLFLLSAPVLLFSCSASKKLRTAQASYNQLNAAYLDNQAKLRACESDVKKADDAGTQSKLAMQAEIDRLHKQVDFLKANSNQTLNELKDLSVISGTQAASIKESIDNINSKDSYIGSLQSAIARKDALNMQLVNNLKGALANVNDQDVNIKVDKGVVYIDISDKMLFKSGSYIVTERAKEVLGKVAQVLNAHPEIEFMVEGHTDNVPYANGVLVDNWDLSTKRATSVVRILQNNYNIDPKRITAAGRSEYVPLDGNNTVEGRAANRRTRIVILPQLDQFFKLAEKKA